MTDSRFYIFLGWITTFAEHKDETIYKIVVVIQLMVSSDNSSDDKLYWFLAKALYKKWQYDKIRSQSNENDNQYHLWNDISLREGAYLMYLYYSCLLSVCWESVSGIWWHPPRTN